MDMMISSIIVSMLTMKPCFICLTVSEGPRSVCNHCYNFLYFFIFFHWVLTRYISVQNNGNCLQNALII